MSDRLRRFRAAWHVPECRALLTAHLISGVGDWMGRLALAVIVFERSESAAWAAAVTAVSLIPWLGFGQMLATTADRFGRLQVMVATDIARAVLFAAMAFTTSVPALLVGAFLAGLCVPPFAGARSAALVEVTDDRTYPSALALFAVITQAEVLVGYAAGGALIAVFGARPALLINAATFLLSAAALAGLRRSAAATAHTASVVGWAGVVAGARVWRVDPVCARALILFAGTAMFSVLPEALVVPFTAHTGISQQYLGVFAALVAVGSMAAIAVAPHTGTPEQILRRTALYGLTAALFAGSLYAISGSLLVGAAAYMVSGAVDAIAVPTNQVVGPRLPPHGRAAAMAVAVGVQNVTGVVAITTAGIAADLVGTRWVLAAAMFAAAAVCIASAAIPIRSDPAAPIPAEPSTSQ